MCGATVSLGLNPTLTELRSVFFSPQGLAKESEVFKLQLERDQVPQAGELSLCKNPWWKKSLNVERL